MRQKRNVEKTAMAGIVLLCLFCLAVTVNAQEQRARTFKKLAPTTQSAPKTSSSVSTIQKSTVAQQVQRVQSMKAFSAASPELKELTASFLTMQRPEGMRAANLVNLSSYRSFMKRFDASGIAEIKAVLAHTKNREVKSALVMLLSAAGVNQATKPATKDQIVKMLEAISLTPYRPGDMDQFLALMGLSSLLEKTAFTDFVRRFDAFHQQGGQRAVQQYIYNGVLQEMKSNAKAPPRVAPNQTTVAPRAR